MDGWNTTFLLGRPIFKGYVSFREGTLYMYLSLSLSLYIYIYIYPEIRKSVRIVLSVYHILLLSVYRSLCKSLNVLYIYIPILLHLNIYMFTCVSLSKY